MKKRSAAILVASITAVLLAILGIGLWKLMATLAPPATPAARPTAAAMVASTPSAPSLPARPAPTWGDEVEEEESEGPPAKLDPKSDAFYERTEQHIPDRLYGAAAEKCWRRGLLKDKKVKLGMKIRSINGRIAVADVKVLETTMSDPALIECIRSAVQNAGWTDEEMPDWEDEDELVIRPGGMKKHLSNFEDDEDPAPEEQHAMGPDWDQGEGTPVPKASRDQIAPTPPNE